MLNEKDIKSLSPLMAERLNDDGWTIENLAKATPEELTVYSGIGKIIAGRIIKEAAEVVAQKRLGSPDPSETEVSPGEILSTWVEAGLKYLDNPNPPETEVSPEEILTTWVEAGLPVQDIALASAEGLAESKGVSVGLAYSVISKAMDIVNRDMLYRSRGEPVVYGGQPGYGASSAFDERWLSGEVEPPPMSVRVQKTFDQAKEEWKLRNDYSTDIAI